MAPVPTTPSVAPTTYAIYMHTPGICYLRIDQGLTYQQATDKLHDIENTEYHNGKRVRWLPDHNTLAVLSYEGPYHGMIESTYRTVQS